MDRMGLIGLSCFLIFTSNTTLFAQRPNKSVTDNLLLWDDKPATDWMTQAYPIGNGRMGAMVFGGVSVEQVQFNENTLWTGDEQETGSYQAFGDLFVELGDIKQKSAKVTTYRRQLDISTGIQAVSYSQNKVNYKREYFCSFPDKATVLKFSADKKGIYNAIISLKDAHGSKVEAKGNTLLFSGKLANGLSYTAIASVKIENGSFSVKTDSSGNQTLVISGADGFSVLLTAATDYINTRKLNWRGETSLSKAREYINLSSCKSIKDLREAHLKDYTSLFGRVSLNLEGSSNEQVAASTFDRIVNYPKKDDPQLEALLFQYGRYLLISSSRKGGLPANLQGLWNNSNTPPWRSDYHSNINIQMNYWPAEVTNLAECHIPYLDYINSIRAVARENTLKQYPGVRGWTVRTENNIFGGSGFVWNTPGSAWYCQTLWEHFSFNGDQKYLRDFAYPILKEIVQFWDDHLRRRPNGVLVSPMGWSPEHGPTEDGVSYDQQIVYDLFSNYINASIQLKLDQDYREHIIDLKNHLLGPKIGKWGQLQEWEEDRDDPNDKHRHASHLFGLFPGKQFSLLTTPELARAAETSLLARGDESTGWSMAWKVNFWARLQNGDHAHRIISNFITLAGNTGVDYNQGGGVYSNLLCAHPPFQIDGNLGYTAGVAELILQSHTGYIQLLPALPSKWQNGQCRGLRARGGFQIDQLRWKKGEITDIKITSLTGNECKLISNSRLISTDNIPAKRSKEGYVYRFRTQKGKTYIFKGLSNV